MSTSIPPPAAPPLSDSDAALLYEDRLLHYNRTVQYVLDDRDGRSPHPPQHCAIANANDKGNDTAATTTSAAAEGALCLLMARTELLAAIQYASSSSSSQPHAWQSLLVPTLLPPAPPLPQWHSSNQQQRHQYQKSSCIFGAAQTNRSDQTLSSNLDDFFAAYPQHCQNTNNHPTMDECNSSSNSSDEEVTTEKHHSHDEPTNHGVVRARRVSSILPSTAGRAAEELRDEATGHNAWNTTRNGAKDHSSTAGKENDNGTNNTNSNNSINSNNAFFAPPSVQRPHSSSSSSYQSAPMDLLPDDNPSPPSVLPQQNPPRRRPPKGPAAPHPTAAASSWDDDPPSSSHNAHNNNPFQTAREYGRADAPPRNAATHQPLHHPQHSTAATTNAAGPPPGHAYPYPPYAASAYPPEQPEPIYPHPHHQYQQPPPPLPPMGAWQNPYLASRSSNRPEPPPPPLPQPVIRESLKRKFQPPVKRLASERTQNNDTNHTIGNSSANAGSSARVHGLKQPVASGSTFLSRNKKTDDGKDENDDLPEELQRFGKELVEKIENEIMESGDSISFDQIAGLADQKQTVQEVVCWPMKRPDLFTGLRRAPNGLLLYGPPGTGKTLIGKAIAHESGATFFSISSSSLTSKWIGEGEKLVRVLFAVAAYRQPAVVFIDEIDSLLTQRKADENEASRRIKTEFLVCLDGTGTSGQGRVLVIGATNRPQELDEAARRRFTKRLYVPLPERNDREILIRTLLSNNNHRLIDEDIQALARDTDGFSGADLQSLCTDAAMGPIRKLGAKALEVNVTDVPAISYKHFRQALKGMKPSVSPDDLQQYIEWDKTFGSKRAESEIESDDDDM